MSDRSRSMPLVAAVVGVLAIVGVVALVRYGLDDGDGGAGDSSNRPALAGPQNPDGSLYARAMVLESPDHGPQLCANVDDSYPPQCGGVDLVGWDWDAVAGEESAGGTTWGEYTVFGTYDGHALTITRDPIGGQHDDWPPLLRLPDSYTTQCPEPPGGWTDVDPATSTNAALHRGYGVAEALPDFTAVFADTQHEAPILNVLVTGDIDAAERAVREVWGGPLCVGAADHTAAELEQIQRELGSAPGFTGSAVEAASVVAWVWYDDGTLQHQYDGAYGSGTVRVFSLLEPYKGN